MYRAIQAVHDEQGFSVKLLCMVAGIERSSYYKWVNHKPGPQERENEQLTQNMLALHAQVRGIYGYRRHTVKLSRDTDKPINHKRIRRLMKIAGIQSVIRRKKKRYPRSTPQHIAENVLNRKFQTDVPNEKWLTDVTELKYGHGQKAYLSAILDLHGNTIVSSVLGHSNNNKLVFETLDQALEVAPGATPMLHSDRGFQYTSKKFKQKLDKAEMIQSMSRVGRCIDNGPMEAFWGTLKCEMYYLNTYSTFEKLKKDIEGYIHFYNNERLQAKLNGLSPVEFRTKAA
ncbi:IS3 family transposase [Paenibacillus sp. FJAT-26967]|uniref:IS3 family transposase n=1 Tax=Paenibacillus sp. FJAT-26967 TaxID=1729690 RepID=UPI0009FEA9BA|nr:IS3 family transposase [Paenibacillus sp. FJAT-26967]